MSAPQTSHGATPDLDYAIAQYHREKEDRRAAELERDALLVQVATLKAALVDIRERLVAASGQRHNACALADLAHRIRAALNA